ncbi:hypothetical protein [Aeromicrobium sp. CF3.5]|uniref:hypothetical protein n=1 Tax=Aeromicrobium sp. CF3.5 TaxID=3373078 RepID=UPI003EE4976A
MFRRALFAIELPAGGGGESKVYAVDVQVWGDKNGEVKAHLYMDGLHHAESKIPARLPVPGGVIEVEVTTFGLKRCHFVSDSGTERHLTPHPQSAEGRRAGFERNHPSASRWVGIVSVILILVGGGLAILQIIEPISEVPPLASRFGTFDSPVDLPLWAVIALGAGAVLGSTERALRLQYSWLDSLAS